jgi:SNF2 family DNA or RNA helicase
MLTALLRLRQVCSHPASVPKVTYKKTPPKINVLIEQVEALLDKGESVLVFTNFLTTLDYIESIFEKHRYTALTLHGSKTLAQRRKTLKQFDESEEPMVLLMTLKTGGVGLNLTKANHVFHLEPWWNPASENQGTDRVHRMGQKQQVHVTRFIMEHSVEEKIQDLKLGKTQRFNALFSESVDELEKLKAGALKKEGLSKADFDHLLDM